MYPLMFKNKKEIHKYYNILQKKKKNHLKLISDQKIKSTTLK